MMPAAVAKCFQFDMVKPYADMNLAMAKAVANLANSAGCNLIGPKTIHDREPFMEWGLKMVAKSNNKSSA